MSMRRELTTTEQIEKMRQELSSRQETANHWRKPWKRRIVNGIYILILSIFFAAFASVMKMKQSGQIPNILGFYLFSVESGSMSPTLEVGDIFVSKKPSSFNDLTTGTIVTFYNTDGQIVTHRITEVITDDSGAIVYQTKGDYEKNTIDLEYLTQDRIISVYCFTLKHS